MSVAVDPQLEFAVAGIEAVEHTVVPTLRFRVTVDAGARAVRALALTVQLRIDARRNVYDAAQRERLYELFGAPGDWGRTLRSLRWTTVTVNVPAFTSAAIVDVDVPCTYDFDVVATKYLHALGDGGEAPVELLFSGTVFYESGGRLRVERVAWDREARAALPVRVWREAVERAFPGTAWLRVGRDVFDRLQAYKSSRALPTWDAALEELLPDE